MDDPIRALQSKLGITDLVQQKEALESMPKMSLKDQERYLGIVEQMVQKMEAGFKILKSNSEIRQFYQMIQAVQTAELTEAKVDNVGQNIFATWPIMGKQAKLKSSRVREYEIRGKLGELGGIVREVLMKQGLALEALAEKARDVDKYPTETTQYLDELQSFLEGQTSETLRSEMIQKLYATAPDAFAMRFRQLSIPQQTLILRALAKDPGEHLTTFRSFCSHTIPEIRNVDEQKEVINEVIAQLMQGGEESRECAAKLVEAILKSEIESTLREGTLLRGNSPASRLLTAYLKIALEPFAEEVLKPLVEKVKKSDISTEDMGITLLKAVKNGVKTGKIPARVIGLNRQVLASVMKKKFGKTLEENRDIGYRQVLSALVLRGINLSFIPASTDQGESRKRLSSVMGQVQKIVNTAFTPKSVVSDSDFIRGLCLTLIKKPS